MTRQITERQAEMYESYKQGKGYRLVAQEYDVHPTTVQKHIKSVEQKLERTRQYRDALGYDTIDEMLDGED